MSDFINIQNSFKENGYVIIRDYITKDIANISYYYCRLKVINADKKQFLHPEKYLKNWDGDWEDIQSSNTYSLYGDPYMDSLLFFSTKNMENYTGLQLVPTYSYWRFYKYGDILEQHIDRPSCEISTTLCLGYDISNVDKTKYTNYNWPIFLKNKLNKIIEVNLNPGDMLIYKGCDLEHWREKYLGLNHAQVFLHFNDVNGKFFNEKAIYDGRKSLGLPKDEAILKKE
jgi:hypothetical protein